jgi:hypothetical protein
VEKNAAESKAASRWYNGRGRLDTPDSVAESLGLEGAVYGLAIYPDRCPVAPEARNLRRELRHLLFGQKPHVYRVIYQVDERRQAVWVLTVRHGARKLKATDVG